MIARFVARLIGAQAGWARPLGDFNHRWLKAIFRPLGPVKDFLNGKWLGHSLHAVLTDVPIGAFTLAVVFDLLDQRAAADVAIGFGLLSVLAALVAGLADYTDTDAQPRMVATVHATLMTLATVAYLASFALRLGGEAGDRTVPIILGLVGYTVLAAGAWVGGDIVYGLGNMINRHAFRFSGKPGWIKLDVTDIPEGELTRAKAGAQNIVLVRTGETILALHDVCAHAGGPAVAGPDRRRIGRVPVAFLALRPCHRPPHARPDDLRPAGLRGPRGRERWLGSAAGRRHVGPEHLTSARWAVGQVPRSPNTNVADTSGPNGAESRFGGRLRGAWRAWPCRMPAEFASNRSPIRRLAVLLEIWLIFGGPRAGTPATQRGSRRGR